MNRRQFINHSTKLAGSALIATQIPGCLKYDDLFYPGLSNGITWFNQQMVIDKTTNSLTVDDTDMTAPCVIKDGSTYKMWYSGFNGNYVICFCDSTDGIHWSNFSKTIYSAGGIVGQTYEGTNDNGNIFGPAVLKINSVYHMWYSGSNASWWVLYCNSNDGINWGNFKWLSDFLDPGLPNAYMPKVLKNGSKYQMWYRKSADVSIYYAESTDKTTWTNLQNIGVTTSAPTVSLIYNGSIYKMWYTDTTSTILYAESNDGINWFNNQLTNITTGYHPHVINDYGVGKMWYRGTDGNIYYAESY